MSQIPQLPQHVSPDGKEIWDWAGKFSEHIHRKDAIRKLQARISKLGTRCGDCDKWMCSSLCPQEVLQKNGQYVGPSMNGFICSKFGEQPMTTELRTKLQAELDALLVLDKKVGEAIVRL